MIRHLLLCGSVGLGTALLVGCESTVDQANKIAAKGQSAFAARGLTIAQTNAAFHVVDATTITDPNGTAVVVQLRYTGRTALANAPILINVLSPRGQSVFANNAAGIEPSLDHLPPVQPGQTVDWVNDQVTPSGTPARVKVTVGSGQAARGVSALQISKVSLTNDPTSGAEANGVVVQHGRAPITGVVVYAVARRGAKVVAAGRAIIQRLAPNKPTHFHAFFIGNPQGAQLSVSALAALGGA